MNYEEARAYLDTVAKRGSVPGLETIGNLMKELGNPQDELKYIHIAGTNGKGSVLAYTSAILTEAGYKTGRYSSPAVIGAWEGIAVDAVCISREEIAEIITEIRKAADRMEEKGAAGPTVFEMETAAAFLYFQKKQCDLVVLETMLGGRLDATNIVTNTLVAAFVSISMDHMGFLGNTPEEIASNKAGIIKPGCVVVTAPQQTNVQNILEAAAKDQGCPFRAVDGQTLKIHHGSYKDLVFSYGELASVHLSQAGIFQAENGAVACEIVKALKGAGYLIPQEAVRAGFEKTVWPGRFTCVREDPICIVDGAHNADAARRLRESIERYLGGRRLIFIAGIFRDKEYRKIAAVLGPLAERIYTVKLPNAERSLSTEELKVVMEDYCPRVYGAASVKEAAKLALADAKSGDAVIAFGSLSYLGEMIKELQS